MSEELTKLEEFLKEYPGKLEINLEKGKFTLNYYHKKGRGIYSTIPQESIPDIGLFIKHCKSDPQLTHLSKKDKCLQEILEKIEENNYSAAAQILHQEQFDFCEDELYTIVGKISKSSCLSYNRDEGLMDLLCSIDAIDTNKEVKFDEILENMQYDIFLHDQKNAYPAARICMYFPERSADVTKSLILSKAIQGKTYESAKSLIEAFYEEKRFFENTFCILELNDFKFYEAFSDLLYESKKYFPKDKKILKSLFKYFKETDETFDADDFERRFKEYI